MSKFWDWIDKGYSIRQRAAAQPKPSEKYTLASARYGDKTPSGEAITADEITDSDGKVIFTKSGGFTA